MLIKQFFFISRFMLFSSLNKIILKNAPSLTGLFPEIYLAVIIVEILVKPLVSVHITQSMVSNK